MARKKDQEFPLNKDAAGDFQDEDALLNYRPNLNWEEPEEEFLEEASSFVEAETIEDARSRTEALINGYNRVKQIAQLVQKRVDNRVNTSGGLDITLDPTSDASTIAAIKRRFPTKDPTRITFSMYKQALSCMQNQALPPPAVQPADVQAAKNNPATTNLGGWKSPPGSLRAEVSSSANSMKPVDLNEFQGKAILKTFLLMLNNVRGTADEEVKKHEQKYKHTPNTGPTDPSSAGSPPPGV